MAKKSKSKKSSGSFKEFFKLHVEKIGLGVVLLLVGVFVWMGWNVETFPASKSPTTLNEVINRASTNIKQETWPNVEATVHPPTISKPIVLNVQPDQWQLGALNPAIKSSRSKRRDPQIYAPTKLVVDAATGPMETILDPDTEVFPPLDVLKAKYQEDLQTAASPYAALDTKKSTKKKKKSGYDSFAEPPTSGSAEMATAPKEKGPYGAKGPRTAGGGYSGGGGGGGYGGSGYVTMSSGGSGGGSGGYGMAATEGPVYHRSSGQSFPRIRNMVALRALIPYEKQFEEYLDALAGNAAAFAPERDTPNYIFFYVERADVTANPDADPKTLTWKPLSTRTAQALYMQRGAEWPTAAEELIDPAYAFPGMTLPVPPIMLTDLKKLSGHPDVPWASAYPTDGMVGPNGRRGAGEEEDPTDLTEGPEGPEVPDPSAIGGPGAQGSGYPGAGAGMPSSSGMRGSGGMPSSSGMRGSGGYPGSAGMRGSGGMPSSGGIRSSGGYTGSAGMRGSGGMPSSGGIRTGYGSGYGGGGGGYGMSGSQQQVPTYKLFRFIDFDVERGHKYRYRVKLTLENPNHPAIPPMANVDPSPLPQTLSKETEAGLKELAKKEAQTGKRIFYRDTEWSEASPVVTIPDPVELAVGEPTGARGEPSSKIMMMQFDEHYATKVFSNQEVQRGSVLNFKTEAPTNAENEFQADAKIAEALYPGTSEYVPLPPFEFVSNLLVVDVRGGEKRGGLNAPSRMAMVDPYGNLVVQTEEGDNEVWQRYASYEPKPDPTMSEYGPGGAAGYGDVLAPGGRAGRSSPRSSGSGGGSRGSGGGSRGP